MLEDESLQLHSEQRRVVEHKVGIRGPRDACHGGLERLQRCRDGGSRRDHRPRTGDADGPDSQRLRARPARLHLARRRAAVVAAQVRVIASLCRRRRLVETGRCRRRKDGGQEVDLRPRHIWHRLAHPVAALDARRRLTFQPRRAVPRESRWILKGAIRCTSITGGSVVVVAGLIPGDDAVAARRHAHRRRAEERQRARPTSLRHADRRAAVARRGAAVVALLLGRSLNAVAASRLAQVRSAWAAAQCTCPPGLHVALRAAAITGGSVAVVALLDRTAKRVARAVAAPGGRQHGLDRWK